MKIATLVGESNPYGPDPRYALYPDPPGSAGGRLCFKILGLSLRAYVGAFDRVNLLEGPRWSVPRARAAAWQLRLQHSDAKLILFGARVAAAFGCPYDPIGRYSVQPSGIGLLNPDGPILVLPHPSGRCPWWNVDGNVARARAAVELFCGVVFASGRVNPAPPAPGVPSPA